MDTERKTLESESSVAPSGNNNDGAAAPSREQVQELVPAPKRRHPLVKLAVLLLVVAIAAVSVFWLLSGSGRQSTNDAYVEGRIIRISPKVSGQVIALHVDD